jgi:hypothetical protein
MIFILIFLKGPMNTPLTKNNYALSTTLWIVIVIGVLSMLSHWGGDYTKKFTKGFIKKITALVKNAKHYYDLSNQDTDPLTSLMHANYAMAYAQVARLLATDDEINSIGKLNMQELVISLQTVQSTAFHRCTEMCNVDSPMVTGAFVDVN